MQKISGNLTNDIWLTVKSVNLLTYMLDLNEFPAKKKNRIPLKSFYFTTFSIIISSLIYIFHRGPPLPPFQYNDAMIDCHSLSYINSSANDNIINFYLHESETIQYPPEYVPYYISLQTNTKDIVLQFSKAQLKNMSLIDGILKFSLPHPVSGLINVTFQCLGNTFHSDFVKLDKVNDTDDHTYSTLRFHEDENYTTMTNVCLEDGKFLFFAQQPGYSERIPFNQSTIKFEILPLVLPAYLNLKNITRTNETSLLLPPFDNSPWKSVLFNLLPIAQALEDEKNSRHFETKKINFLFRDIPLKGSGDIVKRFSSIQPAKVKEIQCFKRIIIPSSYTDALTAGDPDAIIKQALNNNFTYLRNSFVNAQIQNYKIALPNCFKDLEETITEICPQCSISIIPTRMEIPKIADLVGSSQILIGNHISNLIHMIWLTPYKTAVLDLTSEHYSCNHWARNLSNNLNISYFNIYKDGTDNCKCKTFICYPKGPGDNPQVDIDKFKELFKGALETISEHIHPTADEEEHSDIESKEKILVL